MTITFVAESNPSISVRIWLSVCSRSSLPPLKPATPLVRERPIASSSSMKTIDGAFSFASLNRSRTRAAPTPTIASTNSDAAIEKNGTSASPATARASSVLPVPGRPGEQDAVRNATAQPAVLLRIAQEVDDLAELVLGLLDAGDVREGHLVARRLVAAGARPTERAERVLHVAALGGTARRAGATNRIVGPKPNSSVCHHGAPVSSGSALTVTSFSWSSWESSSVSANAGISVRNRVVGFDSSKASSFSNVPWMSVPLEVISSTLPVLTC